MVYQEEILKSFVSQDEDAPEEDTEELEEEVEEEETGDDGTEEEL